MINPFGPVYGTSAGAPLPPINALPVSHHPEDASGLFLRPYDDAYGHNHADDAYIPPFVHRYDELRLLPVVPFVAATGAVFFVSALGLLLPGRGAGQRQRVANEGSHWFQRWFNPTYVPNLVEGSDTTRQEARHLLGDMGNVRSHQRLNEVSSREQLEVQSHIFKTQGGRQPLTDALDKHERAMHRAWSPLELIGQGGARRKNRRQMETFQRAIRDLGLMENDNKAKAHGFHNAMDARLHYIRCLVAVSETMLGDKRTKASFSASNTAYHMLETIATQDKLRKQIKNNPQYQAVYDQLLMHNTLIQGVQQLRLKTAAYSVDKAQSKLDALVVRAQHEPSLLGPVRQKWLKEIQDSDEFRKYSS
jgi:hypothetical protein